jgi:hypothetical protein|uniref:Uncharacterized protein n=1 Tax=Populus trichocarpa TaxID=3694 RepID=A0A2K2B9A7_POPTR
MQHDQSLLKTQTFFANTKKNPPFLTTVSCSKSSSQPTPSPSGDNSESERPQWRLSQQSSWEAKDSEGKTIFTG